MDDPYLNKTLSDLREVLVRGRNRCQDHLDSSNLILPWGMCFHIHLLLLFSPEQEKQISVTWHTKKKKKKTARSFGTRIITSPSRLDDTQGCTRQSLPHDSKTRVCNNKDCSSLSKPLFCGASLKGWLLHQCLSAGLLLQASLSAAEHFKESEEEGMERVLIPAFGEQRTWTAGLYQTLTKSKGRAGLLP